MGAERGEVTAGGGAKPAKGGRLLGSLKEALMAAARDDTGQAAAKVGPAATPKIIEVKPMPAASVQVPPAAERAAAMIVPPVPSALSAEEAARLARTGPAPKAAANDEFESPPTTRVVRRGAEAKPARTQLVRGRQKIERGLFEADPVVGFLIVVGGPGLGAHRPIFEGNNTVGRSSANRIALDFGDDTISSEEQAYIRYDGTDRSFLFVPNLAKTNIVSVNDKRPAGAVELKTMDVITLGRTQVAFLPFCGHDFDWSEISES
jgi:hypothetical protein